MHRSGTPTAHHLLVAGSLALSLGLGAPAFAGAATNAAEHRPAAPSHLYVGPIGQHAVYTFPLKDGLPTQRYPSSVLYVPNIAVYAVAVDLEGYLYVTSGNTGDIAVYRPGAKGFAAPVGFIHTSASFLGEMFVTGRYIVADCGPNSTPCVFAKPPPRYLACSACVLRPLETLQISGSFTRDLTLGADGSLFVALNEPGSPINKFTNTGIVAMPYSLTPTLLGIGNGAIAVDSENVYIAARHLPYIAVDVFAASLPGPQERQLTLPPCRSQPPNHALATYGNYLYLSCEYPRFGVYIYDKRGSGVRMPIASLTSPLQDPPSIALGP